MQAVARHFRASESVSNTLFVSSVYEHQNEVSHDRGIWFVIGGGGGTPTMSKGAVDYPHTTRCEATLNRS